MEVPVAEVIRRAGTANRHSTDGGKVCRPEGRSGPTDGTVAERKPAAEATDCGSNAG